MIPSNRTATHPGIILLKEFLEPLELTPKALAKHVGVPVQRVNEIVLGKRGITPDTAWLFSGTLRTTPEFWLNLQSTHYLSANRPAHRIEPLVAAGK
jgi:antitoxin HigA-1